MIVKEFIDRIYNVIRSRDPDLAETFLRCIHSDVTIRDVQVIILDAIVEEYASVDEETDLYTSITNLSLPEWLERFEFEFLKVLTINHFKPEQILYPLHRLTNGDQHVW